MHFIQCNGLPWIIAENLYSALLHLRSDQFRKHFWIDAICLNQQNISERNIQLGSIGQIYEIASTVIIWLGVSCESSTTVFRWANSTRAKMSHRKTREISDQISLPTVDSSESPIVRDDVEAPFNTIYSVADLEHLIRSMIDLFERPWFRRKWVRQELGRANFA